jgi:hypothetical protein
VKGREVAWISLEGGDWTDLGLDEAHGSVSGPKAGLNALWLKRIDANVWVGWVKTPDGDSNKVNVSIYRAGSDHPAVAVFDEDQTTGQPLIGIRCGSKRWCVVAPANLATVNPIAASWCSESTHPETCRKKGWYDLQRLAKLDGSGKLVPSDSYGTVYPIVGLGNIDTFTTFKTVATARVTGADYTKVVTLPAGTTVPFVFHDGGRVEIDVKVSSQARASARLTSYDSGDFPTQSVILDVVRYPGLNPLGTARWRWSDLDEGIWVRCGAGCCQVKL